MPLKNTMPQAALTTVWAVSLLPSMLHTSAATMGPEAHVTADPGVIYCDRCPSLSRNVPLQIYVPTFPWV
eukprot:m.353207 g.353207  ORF g.353207 m.353207 type:complete len:70 (-) comp16590_c0_seq2:991-1200(-)